MDMFEDDDFEEVVTIDDEPEEPCDTDDPEDQNESLNEEPMGEGIGSTRRITTQFMTKYERARIIGTRALQIAMGAPPLVPLNGMQDPMEIAMVELEHKVIPITVRRWMPDGSFEDWSVNELVIPA